MLMPQMNPMLWTYIFYYMMTMAILSLWSVYYITLSNMHQKQMHYNKINLKLKW